MRSRGIVRQPLCLISVIAVVLAAVTDPARGQCEVAEWAKLYAFDGEPYDNFGWALDILGDVAVIGMEQGGRDGRAYVYRFDGSGWIDEALLSPVDGATYGDQFGTAVATCDNLIAVGAYEGGEYDDGVVYMFRFDGTEWIAEDELTGWDEYPYYLPERFGCSVAVSGDVLVVGADDGPSPLNWGEGAAYVFRHNGSVWNEEAMLVQSDWDEEDYFGSAVAVSGDVIVVGAPEDCFGNGCSGSAYVFRFNGSNWVEETILTASDADDEIYFGRDVAVSGDRIVVGAPADGYYDVGPGAVYVFRYNGAEWAEEAKLTISVDYRDTFGYSVDIDGDIIVAGPADFGTDVCVFQFDGAAWNESVRFSEWAAYRGPVAVSADTALIGLPYDTELDWDAGAVCVLRGLSDCNGNDTIDVCDIDQGASFDDNGNGVPDECEFPDCNGNGVPDDDDISGGTSDDLNGNGIPDECDDCNDNGTLDDQDIAGGASEDCNGDDVPDECNITDGTSADCNRNDVPDECDIAAGTSLDEDGNGVPDECEFDCLAAESAKLLSSNGAEYDQYGIATALSGDTAVVGAYRGDGIVEDSGTAYVYQFNGAEWVEQAVLTAADGADDDWFGIAVAISGDTIVVGASLDEDHGYATGAAYVFRHDGDTWVEEAKLTASDGASSDYFGYAVAVSGDTILAGAHRDDDLGSSSGSVYVYEFNGSEWVEQDKLHASDGATGDYFGYALALSSDVAVVGAERNDDAGSQSGSAYVFRYNGTNWVEEAKLTASDASWNDYFGRDVALGSDVAVIGASQVNYGQGAAYVFRFNGAAWIEEAKLTASDGMYEDAFASRRTLAISGDTVLIGAGGDDDEGFGSGAAYVFRFDGQTWAEEAKFTVTDGDDGLGFGWGVALSGDTAVVGCNYDDDNGQASGSVYIYRSLADCNGNGVLDICDVGDGVSQDCNANGLPDECDIASGISDDCQPNGVPDECDLVDGTSLDENGNGIPDECEYGAMVVYSNLEQSTDPNEFYLPQSQTGVPYGDDLHMIAGGWLDEFTFVYFDPPGGTALGQVEVLFYENDPNNSDFPGGDPGCVLLGSYTVADLPGDGSHIVSVGVGLQSLSLPEDIWVEFDFADSLEAGLMLYNPPTVGSSTNLFEVHGINMFVLGYPHIANFGLEIVTRDEQPGCPNSGDSGNYCTADIDGSGDCVVNLADLAALLGAYGTCPGDALYNPDADLTDDGNACIAIADLAELLGQYGDDCN